MKKDREPARAWRERDQRWASGAELAALDGARANVLAWTTRLPRDTDAGAEEVRDLYNAAASLGRIMAELDVSRVLAAETLDNLCEAAALGRPAWLPGAKAALFEGFVASREARAQELERTRWAEPVVPLGEGRVAVFAALESDDEGETRAWADALVGKLAKRRVRSIVVAGREAPVAALLDAAGLAGIAAILAGAEPPAPPSPAPKRRFWPFG